MYKCIIMILITCTVFAQADSDKLVLKNGLEYLGEYSRIEGKVVYFKPKAISTEQTFKLYLIETLQLKSGEILIDYGQPNFLPNLLPKYSFKRFTKVKKLKSYEYEKLTIEEKVFYDANRNARKWLFYPILTGFTFCTSIFGSMNITNEEPWENLLAMIGISITSLALPYYGLKHLDKNQEVEISPEDIQKYKRIYSEEFNSRKSQNIVKGFGLLGLTAAAGYYLFLATFSLSGDFYFGP